MLETISNLGQKCADLLRLSTPVDKAFASDGTAKEDKNFFQTVLPYRTFDEEAGLYENKHSLGFCLEVSPLIGVYEFFSEEFSSFISEIGTEKDSIQCLLWADHRIAPLIDRWQAPKLKQGGMAQKSAEKRAHFFKKTLREQTDCPPARDFRFFFSYSSPRKQKRDLLEKKEKALSFFSRISSAKAMAPKDFIATFSGIINYCRETEVQSRPHNPWNYLSCSLCLHGGLEEKNTHLSFETQDEVNHLKLFEVLEYPNEWDAGLTQTLLGDFYNQDRGIFGDFFLHYGIFFPPQERLAQKNNLKSKSLEKQLRFKNLKTFFTNAQREYEETCFVQKELLEGKKLVQTRITMGVFSKPKSMLDVQGNVKSLFAKMGFKIAPCDRIHADEFIRCLPMTWGESPDQLEMKMLRAYKTTITQETGLFVPIAAEWGGNSTDGVPLFGRRGQLAMWDLFATQGNLNAVVVGAAGSGKSVFMQEIILNLFGTGGRVFVLDLGRSFEKICTLLDGQYLFFTEDSNLKLNPFALIPEGGDRETVDTALGMVSAILSTMAMPMEKMDTERQNMINIAVKKSWALLKHKATVDSVIEALKKSEYTTERMRGKSESLIDALQKYTTTGEYRKFFYGEKEISFQSDFVVIETEELKNKEDLQSVILQIFSLMISTEVFMGDRKKRSLICIDEAWDLLKSPQMEGFIESMARRLRKYNGSLLVGTQGLKDFDRSAGAAAAFQNSNWLVLMGKDGNTIPYIKENNLFEVTPQVERYLGSIRKVDGKYSEAFIYNKESGFYTLVQLRLDPFSAYLYSTKAENFQAIQQLKKEGYTVCEAVEKLVSEKGAV
ncbi:MAG: type IV secretion system protein TraC [Chlamydiota bacterium]